MVDLNETWAITLIQRLKQELSLLSVLTLKVGRWTQESTHLCESLGDDSSAEFLSTKVGDDDGNIKSNLTLAFRWVETIILYSFDLVCWSWKLRLLQYSPVLIGWFSKFSAIALLQYVRFNWIRINVIFSQSCIRVHNLLNPHQRLNFYVV